MAMSDNFYEGHVNIASKYCQKGIDEFNVNMGFLSLASRYLLDLVFPRCMACECTESDKKPWDFETPSITFTLANCCVYIHSFLALKKHYVVFNNNLAPPVIISFLVDVNDRDGLYLTGGND
jgi:hypothetical protein